MAGPMDDAAIGDVFLNDAHLPGGSRSAPGSNRSLVLTMDVITPIVDDPRTFGAIAAANALSDVYAMGGRPELALSFVGFPSDKLPIEALHEILVGLRDTCAQAKCAIVGGHTIVDPEPKCGLSVTGSVDVRHVWSHKHAKAGSALVLTKRIGTGVASQALRAGSAPESLIARITAQMTQLNSAACDVGLAVGATSCTDVTGFGLLGHLRNITDAAGLTARINASLVPLIEGVFAFAEQGVIPGGTKRNLKYVAPVTTFSDSVGEAMRLLLADAQTSGGLLLCVHNSVAAETVRHLLDQGCEGAAIIGELEPRAENGTEIIVE